MKGITIKLPALLLLITLGYNSTIAQINSKAYQKEKVQLFTDRTLYISGEDISFAAYLYSENNQSDNISIDNNFNDILWDSNLNNVQQKNLSTVIYIELITPDGDRIVGGKFLCENSCAKGLVSIPNDLLTGIYYIKAYTKYMRNYGPTSYNFVSLKIINPLKSDILAYNSSDSVIINNSISKQDIVSVVTDKDEYLIREPVNVQLKGINTANYIIKGISLSVVPEYSYNETNTNTALSDDSIKDQYFYAEPNGISLTGTLKDSRTELPMPNTIVNLSILGDCRDFVAVKTNSNGRFFFKIPDFTGVRDIFICTEMIEDSKSTILIDNDFCQRKFTLLTPAFNITEDEKRAAFNLAQNIQISSVFYKNNLTDSTKFANKAFYGEPHEKLIFDQYVQLPTIEDYINEIIPTLKIRKHKGRKYFRIYRTQTELEIYKPLVLLDLVAIDNPEKILSLSPQNISYVETVNAPYIKGDIIYGGIISFFSKKSDFAGVDLPSSGLFLDFNFLGKNHNSSKNTFLKDNQPDSRNTVLWEPSISLNTKNTYEQSFVTADTPGKYIVLVRGITKDGKTFSIKKSILIKK